VSQALIKGAYY